LSHFQPDKSIFRNKKIGTGFQTGGNDNATMKLRKREKRVASRKRK
jgi:hypothetical protein